MSHLPVAKPDLPSHTKEPGNTDTTRITNSSSAQRELTIFLGDTISNLSEGVDVHHSTQETLPENDDEDNPHAGNEIKQGVESQQCEIGYLEERGNV